MEKICFECGIKGQELTGPVFLPAKKLKEFYLNLEVSDPTIEKLQEGDLLCSKCARRIECRHALKCHNYYQEKWTPEQYEIWAKSNAELILLAENELKEKTKPTNQSMTSGGKISIDTLGNKEKLAIIYGNPAQNGQPDSTGLAIINSDLSAKFEAFCNSHKGKIIDWNVGQQNNSGNCFIFIRYFE